MSNQPATGHGELELDLVRRIDAACRRFEQDSRAGSNPAIVDYLPDVPEEGRPALSAELNRSRELGESQPSSTAELTAIYLASTAARRPPSRP